ncbi:hypothetical protein [Pseudoneobacillus sp. C159]
MMEKNLENLKLDINAYISDDKIFTERDRKNIRVKMLEAQFQKPNSKAKGKLLPFAATCTAGLLFFILFHTFLGDSFSRFFEKGSGTSQQQAMVDSESPKRNGGSGSAPVKEISRFVIDPATVKVGDLVNSFKVAFVPENVAAEDVQSKRFGIVLEGDVKLSGTIEILTEENQQFAVFLPDKGSLSALPLVAGVERDTPLIKLMSDSKAITEMLGLMEGEQRKVEIRIDMYAIFHHTYPAQAGLEQYDQARVFEINGVSLEGTISGQPSQQKEYHMVEETLILTYDKLVATLSENELKGLKPLEVFRLYWQAFEFGNIELRHFLLGGPDVPDLATFANEVVEKQLAREQELYEKIREKGLDNLVAHENGNTAYIDITGDKFNMIKTESGVWKVKFSSLP